MDALKFFGLKSIDDIFEDVEPEESDDVIVISDSDSDTSSEQNNVNHRKSIEIFKKRMSTVGSKGEDQPPKKPEESSAQIDKPVLTEEQRKIINENRLLAYKKLLNKCDVENFDQVPTFIVESFFGSPSYKKRLVVTSFGFLNGVSPYQLNQLIHWNPRRKKDWDKCTALYEYYKAPNISQHYWSFHRASGLVRFLNGDVRNKFH
jgi:hypothetical protein